MDFKEALMKKKLIIDVSDMEFENTISKFGYFNIFSQNYILPFLKNNKWGEDYDNAKFSTVIEFYKFNIWLGNTITEILHYAEIMLVGKILNYLMQDYNVDITKSFESNIKIFAMNEIFNDYHKVLTQLYEFKNSKENQIISLEQLFSSLSLEGIITIFDNLNAKLQDKIRNSYFIDNPLIKGIDVDPLTFKYIYSCIHNIRNTTAHIDPIYKYKFESRDFIDKYVLYLKQYTFKNEIKNIDELDFPNDFSLELKTEIINYYLNLRNSDSEYNNNYVIPNDTGLYNIIENYIKNKMISFLYKNNNEVEHVIKDGYIIHGKINSLMDFRLLDGIKIIRKLLNVDDFIANNTISEIKNRLNNFKNTIDSDNTKRYIFEHLRRYDWLK